jgi:hypothetical protein
MPNQLLYQQQSRHVQTPSHNISSNCLTWVVSVTWLFHNQGENSSEDLSLEFVLSPLVYLSERKMHAFEITTPTASVYPCNL